MNRMIPMTPSRAKTPPTTPPQGIKINAPQFEPLTPDSCGKRGKLKVIVPRKPLLVGDFEGNIEVETRPIGLGSFAQVYRAKCGDKLYAVKTPRKGAYFDTFSNELRALNILNTPGHPNVIHLYGIYDEQGLVLDFYETDLYAAVLKFKSEELFEPIVGQDLWTEWASELALGLEYIHSKDIIHGDLKPNNILVNFRDGKALKPVIADFSSAIVETGSSQVTSPIYSAPEVQNGAEPTNESDIYALGVILVFCASGQEPYSEAKNAIQRVMWQRSVLPMDACGDASIRVNGVRSVVEGMVVGRSLSALTGH